MKLDLQPIFSVCLSLSLCLLLSQYISEPDPGEARLCHAHRVPTVTSRAVTAVNAVLLRSASDQPGDIQQLYTIPPQCITQGGREECRPALHPPLLLCHLHQEWQEMWCMEREKRGSEKENYAIMLKKIFTFALPIISQQ